MPDAPSSANGLDAGSWAAVNRVLTKFTRRCIAAATRICRGHTRRGGGAARPPAMAYEAADVLAAMDQAVSAEKKRGGIRSAQASPLLNAMRAEAIPDFPSRSPSVHSQVVLERVGEIAERAAQRNMPNVASQWSPTLSPSLPSQAPSRRASIDSTNSKASHILYGFPQAYRDAFSGVPSAYAEYAARPSSRASSRSGYFPPFRPTSGASSPVHASRTTRVHRQEILAELTDSSDDDSPGKKRSPRKSTRNVLRSLDLHASDVGSSSSDASPSPRGKAPQMTKDARARGGAEDPHFTTSSTDEDRNRRRAWEEGGASRAHAHGASAARAGHRTRRADGEPSPNRRAEVSDSGSGSDGEGSAAGHESVMHSAASVVRALEQRSRRSNSVDIDEVQDVEEYLAKSRGHTPSQRSNASPDTGKRQTTKATVAPAVQDMLAAAFQNAKGSPPKRPSSAILSASRSPAGKSPQVFSSRKGDKNFVLQTVPAYGPATDLQDSIGLPVSPWPLPCCKASTHGCLRSRPAASRC